MPELVSKFEIYEISGVAPDKAWSWRLLDNKGSVIAKSELGFPKDEIVDVIKTIREGMKTAEWIWHNKADDPNNPVKDKGGKDGDVPGS